MMIDKRVVEQELKDLEEILEENNNRMSWYSLPANETRGNNLIELLKIKFDIIKVKYAIETVKYILEAGEK